MMGNVITSINLGHEGSDIVVLARRKGNLSHFVRDCLVRDAAANSGRHIRPKSLDTYGVCNPFALDGLCYLCFPRGRPSRDDWLTWKASLTGKGSSLPVEWIKERARLNKENLSLFNTGPSEEPVKPPSESPPRLGLLGRLNQAIRLVFRG